MCLKWTCWSRKCNFLASTWTILVCLGSTRTCSVLRYLLLSFLWIFLYRFLHQVFCISFVFTLSKMFLILYVACFAVLVQRWAVKGEEFVLPHHPWWVSYFFFTWYVVIIIWFLEWRIRSAFAMWRCFRTSCGWSGQVK